MNINSKQGPWIPKGIVYSTSTISNSGVKQGCVLAPTLFRIFFLLLLKHAFDSLDNGVYIRTRSDGKLFNLSRLRAKTKVR